MVLIGVHSDPNRAKMAEVVAELAMDWPIVMDPDRKFMKSLEGDSYPDYYLVDRKGKLRFADLANAELDRAVEMLLKEKR